MLKEQINRPFCSRCKINLCKKNGVTKLGIIKYKKHCRSCDTKIYDQVRGNRRMGYALNKKSFCENCRFIPIHPCQLDVDHIDGNHNNNSLDNLQTLCANCHRLKTFNTLKEKALL